MKKHILIVSQYFYPEQFRINDIAKEWVKRGYEVTVLTGIPNYPQGRFFRGYGWFRNRREKWNGVNIVRIPLIPRGKSSFMLVLNYFSFVCVGFFWKTFTRIKADLVFTFEVSPMTQALIGVWYSKKRKIQNFLYVQDLWPENVEIVTGVTNKAIIGPIEKMVDYIYRNCDKIFATSPSFAERIRARVPAEPDKVIYWPQYAEDLYQPTEQKSNLIQQDGIFNITFTGNIGTAQGLEILPEAARLLKEQNTFVRFNIVGEGRNKDNLLRNIKVNGVEKYFSFIPWQSSDKIPSILSASGAAFVSFDDNPLYAMTIPAKLQSYLACGVPIIAAASGETRRIIEEAECGVCCDARNAKALCDIIISLSLSIKERERFSINARKYYETHFDKNMLMDAMEVYIADDGEPLL